MGVTGIFRVSGNGKKKRSGNLKNCYVNEPEIQSLFCPLSLRSPSFSLHRRILSPLSLFHVLSLSIMSFLFLSLFMSSLFSLSLSMIYFLFPSLVSKLSHSHGQNQATRRGERGGEGERADQVGRGMQSNSSVTSASQRRGME